MSKADKHKIRCMYSYSVRYIPSCLLSASARSIAAEEAQPRRPESGIRQKKTPAPGSMRTGV